MFDNIQDKSILARPLLISPELTQSQAGYVEIISWFKLIQKSLSRGATWRSRDIDLPPGDTRCVGVSGCDITARSGHIQHFSSRKRHFLGQDRWAVGSEVYNSEAFSLLVSNLSWAHRLRSAIGKDGRALAGRSFAIGAFSTKTTRF